ncbi:hypothetical protein WH47_02561 [Habropoda laboriosa]|uniref:Uncharacterized protein n=1 Tax=Habropoda laboriosa TaxID=597456 RepID=A0A0L7QW67_9HYME|nr:hypothetical protein WH47_02561 [Habropoda laboriosa]
MDNKEYAMMADILIMKITFHKSPIFMDQKVVGGAINVSSIRVVLSRMQYVFREIIEFDNFIERIIFFVR